jgi:hypothetical protein
MNKHKFRIGAKVYIKTSHDEFKPHQRKGIIRTLSSGWETPMVYVKFGNQSFWVDEKDLIPADFNPSVR